MKTFNTFLFLLLVLQFQAQLKFSNLDSLYAYADNKSISSKVSQQQTLLAKWTKITAIANTVNFRNPLVFSATNNLLLPVNFIPAEAFGGAPGALRQITLGQQYVTSFNYNPQIDIINPGNWAKVQSAQLNKEMTAVNNQLIKKSLHESIAAAYYNVVSLQKQNTLLEKSLNNADSIYLITKNKFDIGIIREQDINNAKVNKLNLQDKLNQIKISVNQQINNLKILCDVPDIITLEISNANSIINSENTNAQSNLQFKYQILQSQFLKNELRATRMSMLPVVSLMYYQGWQKNSNSGFSDNTKWIQSKYIGLRITLPFPPDVTKLSQSYTNKVNYNISELNNEHTKLQNDLSNRSLELDFEKYVQSNSISLEIVNLKTMNYQKSLNQFKEGVLPLDLLLTAFSDLLNSQINQIASETNFEFTKSKILINNQFK